MKKVLLALLFCFAIAHYASAQYREKVEDTTTTDVEDVLKLTVVSPGIGYEMPVGKYQTLYLQGFLSLNGGIGYSGSLGWSSFFYAEPAASVEYRYYYNFEKRQRQQRRVAKNSLNYLSPFFQTRIARRFWINDEGYVEHKGRLVHSLGALWGMQRNYKSHFSLDVNIGVGFYFREEPFTDRHGNDQKHNGRFTIPGRFSIGFWLN